MSVPSPLPADERTLTLQASALELLAIHRDFMERERRSRNHLIRAAQRAGLTNTTIGHALGISEGGVRKSLAREATP